MVRDRNHSDFSFVLYLSLCLVLLFSIGTHTSYVHPSILKGDILEDLVIVHLDFNRVEMPCAVSRRPPPLPTKEKKKLWKKIKLLNLYSYGQTDYEQKRMET